MKQVVDEVAKKFRDAFKESIPDFEGLYVFGSQVRGDATDESDVDIVVLFEQERFSQPDEFYNILSKFSYDYYDLADLDILPYAKKELERNCHFHDEVVNKGVFYSAA